MVGIEEADPRVGEKKVEVRQPGQEASGGQDHRVGVPEDLLRPLDELRCVRVELDTDARRSLGDDLADPPGTDHAQCVVGDEHAECSLRGGWIERRRDGEHALHAGHCRPPGALTQLLRERCELVGVPSLTSRGVVEVSPQASE